MSMPADTPADVMMSPSSTKRSLGRTSIEGSILASSARSPNQVVAGRPASSPAAAYYECSVAHADHERYGFALLLHPGEMSLVGRQRADLASRVNEDINRRHRGEGVMRRNDETPPALDGAPISRDAEDLEAIAGEQHCPHREHFPRTRSVELFHSVEQQNPDAARSVQEGRNLHVDAAAFPYSRALLPRHTAWVNALLSRGSHDESLAFRGGISPDDAANAALHKRVVQASGGPSGMPSSPRHVRMNSSAIATAPS